MITRLRYHYETVIRPDLLSKGRYQNIMEVPELKKIVLNMGVKDVLVNDKKYILAGLVSLERITGQRPTINRAKKSVAAFHVKEHSIVGCKVSLTGDSMYAFLDKLVHVVLPRVKDLKVSTVKSFDRRGNLSLGISDLMIFPEIESEYGKIPKFYGLDINFVTSASTDEDGLMLLSGFQLPVSDRRM